MGASFHDKVVMITGSAGGIGRCLAHEFARAGAKVALVDIDEIGLERLREDMHLRGYQVLSCHCDIREMEQCREAVAEVTATWGGIDVLVNNAGMSHRSLFTETVPEVIRQIMEVNFFGSVYMTWAAIQSIIERKGQIVVISSVAGYAPLIGRTGYAASKHALHGMYDTLRAELVGKGVNILLVCPGFTDTQLSRHALAGDGSRVSMARPEFWFLLKPEEVAKAVVMAAAERKRMLVLSSIARLSLWLSRVWPSLYEKIMVRTQRAEFGRLQ